MRFAWKKVGEEKTYPAKKSRDGTGGGGVGGGGKRKNGEGKK